MIRRVPTDFSKRLKVQTACVNCGTTGLELILDLGKMPLANALLRPNERPEDEAQFPLELCFCEECSLVQISVRVAPEQIFTEYCYYSSYSDTMVLHARKLAERVTAEKKLDSSSLVVEAGSNDGYLLQWYQKLGVNCLGIEPAENVAKVAVQKHSIPTKTDFFGARLARQLRQEGQRADVFHAHNVMAHVPDQPGFLKGIATILKDDGLAVIEVPYVVNMIDELEFDTIYHEHVCYYSLTAVVHAFASVGLRVVDVERIAIHGGSLRIFAVPNVSEQKPSERVLSMLQSEKDRQVDRVDYYLSFAKRVDQLCQSLWNMMEEVHRQGGSIAAYGASAKGATLLNYCGIDSDVVDFVVDRNPAKQGCRMPGCHIPIEHPDQLLARNPTHAILLTWNFADEILEQQAEYRRRGGKFIIPVPMPRIV